MNDVNGNPMAIGDKVWSTVTGWYGGKSTHLKAYTIKSFGKKMVIMEEGYQTRRYPEACVKVSE